MPGIIDIHSDKIEQYIQPRPTSQMDFEFGLKVCERDLLGAGITTIYHSLSLFQDEIFGKGLLRTKDNVQKITELIANIHLRNHLIHHRIHLRIEIDNLEAFDIVRDMINQKKTHLISFMDHTPGHGQYSNLKLYHDTISKYNGREIDTLGFDGVLEHHKNKTMLSVEQLKELSRLAHDKRIAVASHDDDTDKKLALNKEIGVDISEFPISPAAAKSAKAGGFYTVVGSANILRGGSHSGNMSAAEAILEGCGDIICSDYYPAAILNSVFHMHTKHGVPLTQMVNRVTLNPAKALRTDKDYGSIEPGKKADLLIVELLDGYPVITHVFVDGKPTSRIEYRR
jgi:alpha-D-ribose 1-methylphosphonate 5-triphosphate diphosphatase